METDWNGIRSIKSGLLDDTHGCDQDGIGISKKLGWYEKMAC